MTKKIVLFGTNRHAICIDDFYMFFSRSPHSISQIFYPAGEHRHRDWWKRGARNDKARDSIVDPITKSGVPIVTWADVERDVAPVLDALDFDYICVGNGTDEAQLRLIERYGRDRFLFSEYGWMPWSQNFYISRNGCGRDSEIASVTGDMIDTLGINHEALEDFKEILNVGDDVPFDDFVYMPLQKDVNDFKFLTSPFSKNMEFLLEADRLAPPGTKILFKCHPLYKKNYDVSFSERMVDITNSNFNKFQLYSRMMGMMCINSTSVLEAFCFGGKVVSFGEDIFLNKSLTLHRPSHQSEVADFFKNADVADRCRRFVSLLFSRQVDRKRCVNNDLSYVQRHYWSVCI